MVGVIVLLIVSIPLVITYSVPLTNLNFSSGFQSPPTAHHFTEKLADKEEEEKMLMFDDFQFTHSKFYESEDEKNARYEIFKQNLLIIDEMNMKQPLAQYHISPFTDLTEKEFESYYGLNAEYFQKIQAMKELNSEQQSLIGFVPFEISGIDLEAGNFSTGQAFDWRNFDAVTPVKNQLRCGSCWAFAATGDMEGTWKLKTGQLVSLSEEEIISCATSALGCQGGIMSDAYEFVIKNGGISSEAQVPYAGKVTACNTTVNGTAASISGWTLLEVSSPEKLKTAVQSLGPIAVAINAYQMMFYKSGIDVCMNSRPVNHGVLLVGYGHQNGEDYWIIKNSWGPNWGQNGYYFISTSNKACGVPSMPMKSL